MLRTADDVATGESPHPEPVYLNSVKTADAQPVLASARTLDGDDRVAAAGSAPARARATDDFGARAATRSGETGAQH